MSEAGDRQRIAELLGAFDATLREKAGCYLGGGAALVLALGEYRQLNNVNFMCASAEGYRLLRNTVQDALLGALLTRSLPIVREVRTSPYVVSTFLDVQGAPIKVDFGWEIQVAISGTFDAALRIPMLSRVDMYAEKLLANADRGLDRSTGSRDIIDLAMVIRNGGPIPRMSWQKARQAYGDYAVRAFDDARDLIRD
ncbi:nucleotidyl transferase AbiEii/AbiGii toxin family protein [Ancylobacter polymorphus]|uniref:Nucleotidyl transferase AbiEii/AbiGii toxin family protein n=1 Tax=Ancylobacter polymorphus TaxID=223390 RepID=A0ABU0BHT7_9HYPH|nr:nucleotidyl transferase AbiEii/AbiGii toxin family protein [Ancylobacter polymorphus]MDQ0305400.1 hypothetical protein [Ancylobacter polymorphus]